MTVLNTGLNRIRDLIDGDINDGRAGTDTTLPDPTQTTLISPVATTALSVTTVTTDKTITISHTIPSGTANGNTLTEWETRLNSGNISLHRSTTAGVSKVAGIEVTRITTFSIEGN